MDVVTIQQQPATLRRPVLLAAFRGWNDAGECASGAVATLTRELRGERFAEVDPEEFFDFQATRPTVRIVDGTSRAIEWPENTFWTAALTGAERDLVVLQGTEPNLRWRRFSDGVVGLAKDLGVELVVTLGALQVDLPHTRPVSVTGTSSSAAAAEQLGLVASRYEGPTGITGILHHACDQAGLPAASLWAGVPHYLAATPYLAGALALAERALGLLGGEVSLDRLARDAAAQRDDIAELVAADEDLAEYVTELEHRAAEHPERDLPSGDELAAELERFLRQGHEPPDHPRRGDA